MKNRNKNFIRVQREIRKILMEIWDPIDVNLVPEAQGEYDSYIGGIYRLLIDGVSKNDLCKYLRVIEEKKMGMSDVGDTVDGAVVELLNIKLVTEME